MHVRGEHRALGVQRPLQDDVSLCRYGSHQFLVVPQEIRIAIHSLLFCIQARSKRGKQLLVLEGQL